MKYTKSKGGYFYKVYSSGNKVRISKQVYLTKKGGAPKKTPKPKQKSTSKPKAPKVCQVWNKALGSMVNPVRHLKHKTFNQLCMVGHLDINDTIAIGEFDGYFYRVKGGKYNIFRSPCGLLILHQDENLKDVNKFKWANTGDGVGVDGGTINIFNGAQFMQYLEKPTKKNPYVNWPYSNSDRDGYIKHKDIEVYKNGKSIKNTSTKILGYCTGTNFGDGVYGVAQAKKNGQIIALFIEL
jgi:hypothetical protein